MDDKEVLTKEYGIANDTTPTGRVLGILPIVGGRLCEIKFADGKPGTLPPEVSGKFTSVRFARDTLTRYVTGFWEFSDAVPRKRLPSNAVS